MTIQEMQQRKQELGLTNEMIAETSGVPLGTVQKIFAGLTKSPRRSTIQALENVLKKKTFSGTYDFANSLSPDSVRESAPVYEYGLRRGPYTLKDYYALPDDRRVELIDGYIYDMAAPNIIHQTILGQLHLQFAPCVERHPECRLFFAPFDVRLDNDDYTMVQPDLLIICGEGLTVQRMNGAPDFVAEILSPSNRPHDMLRKLGKYTAAGVREYWIVDPKNLVVIVYAMEQTDIPAVYPFQSKIPVRISNGECEIDFEKIYEKIREYLPEP